MTDDRAASIDRSLGRLEGQIGAVHKDITGMRGEQLTLLDKVEDHGGRLAVIESECTRRGEDNSQRFAKQSEELDSLRNCAGRVKIQVAESSLKWKLLLKIAGLILGSGIVTVVVQHLVT